MSDQDQVTPAPPHADGLLAQLDIRLEWVAEQAHVDSDGSAHYNAMVYVNGDLASGPWDTDYDSKLRSTRKAVKKLVRKFIDEGDEAMPCQCETEQATAS